MASHSLLDTWSKSELIPQALQFSIFPHQTLIFDPLKEICVKKALLRGVGWPAGPMEVVQEDQSPLEASNSTFCVANSTQAEQYQAQFHISDQI